jgi:VWFA-related protein
MKNTETKKLLIAIITVVAGILLLASDVKSQKKSNGVAANGNTVTILVTAFPRNERQRDIADKMQPEDFVVLEDKRRQQIVSVKRAGEAPTVLAVLVQDNLVSRVNNEIKPLKEFIRQLPEGSKVMTGYLAINSLSVTQEFTTDRSSAAESLRIVRSGPIDYLSSPYWGVVEAIKSFDKEPNGRRMILLISDSLDATFGLRSASPFFSLGLDRAIREAQRRGIAVFTFYSPSEGWTMFSRLAVNYGQSSLARIADETGGEAFFSGMDFVTFDPYLKEFNELLGRQWLITYRSNTIKKGFRRIEVVTDFDLHLHYPIGYETKKK